MKTLKKLCAAVLALYVLGLISPVGADMDIYGKIIRLHIIANSDSEEDTALKYELRDAVLRRFGAAFSDCADTAGAGELIEESLPDIEEFSAGFLSSRGSPYSVRAEFSNEYYPTREYEGVRLPAGDYASLKIVIGEGKGHNWWCVIFPALCVDSAAANKKLVEAGFSDEQIRILTDNGSPKYVLKFKFMEIYAEAVRKIKEIRRRAAFR